MQQPMSLTVSSSSSSGPSFLLRCSCLVPWGPGRSCWSTTAPSPAPLLQCCHCLVLSATPDDAVTVHGFTYMWPSACLTSWYSLCISRMMPIHKKGDAHGGHKIHISHSTLSTDDSYSICDAMCAGGDQITRGHRSGQNIITPAMSASRLSTAIMQQRASLLERRSCSEVTGLQALLVQSTLSPGPKKLYI